MKFLLLLVTLFLVLLHANADNIRANCAGEEEHANNQAITAATTKETPAPTPAPAAPAAAALTPANAIRVEKTETVENLKMSEDDEDAEDEDAEDAEDDENEAADVVRSNQVSNDVVAVADWRQEMLNAVNSYRVANGRQVLMMDQTLNVAGQEHAEDMASKNYFDHTGLDGSTPMDRARLLGFTAGVGENIAAGQSGVQSVMTEWINSDGHRANILGDYKTFGCGHAYASNAHYSEYWVQEFGN